MAVRIYESAGGIMAERGALRGVADEGGLVAGVFVQ